LWFVLLVFVLWGEVRQEDPGEMYMYVEVKENEHNRGSPKNWRDAENGPLNLWWGGEREEERMNESAAHRVAQD
jgi:hypothetical protein